jgi:hypothetical protein
MIPHSNNDPSNVRSAHSDSYADSFGASTRLEILHENALRVLQREVPRFRAITFHVNGFFKEIGIGHLSFLN